jgi:hypothetical protein
MGRDGTHHGRTMPQTCHNHTTTENLQLSETMRRNKRTTPPDDPIVKVRFSEDRLRLHLGILQSCMQSCFGNNSLGQLLQPLLQRRWYVLHDGCFVRHSKCRSTTLFVTIGRKKQGLLSQTDADGRKTNCLFGFDLQKSTNLCSHNPQLDPIEKQTQTQSNKPNESI